jgi:hypothetical protein
VAAGRDRDVPVVLPTQFVLEGDTVRLHLVRTNPLFTAVPENPRVVLSVAGDWAFNPSASPPSSAGNCTTSNRMSLSPSWTACGRAGVRGTPRRPATCCAGWILGHDG